jgi:hypothetical protein
MPMMAMMMAVERVNLMILMMRYFLSIVQHLKNKRLILVKYHVNPDWCPSVKLSRNNNTNWFVFILYIQGEKNQPNKIYIYINKGTNP